MRHRVILAALAAVLLLPAVAQAATPQLSTSDRLDDKRFVASGSRAYDIGTEAGRYPAMGFHTRGEMGGIWSPPIKLLDGIWFAVDDQWVGPATKFTSGSGFTQMDLPDSSGLQLKRTDFVPGQERGVLVGLTLTNPGSSDRTTKLSADAHSALLGAYPWGETTPSQLQFNQADTAAYEDNALVFREQSPPPAPNADAHDWAAVVAANATPSHGETGDGYRGPQDPPVICPPSGQGQPAAPPRCDDTAYGKGKGGRLDFEVTVPAGGSKSVWLAVGGSETGAADARAATQRMLADPEGALAAKQAERQALQDRTQLDLPGDRLLQGAVDWGKQNLADLVQESRGLKIRQVDTGKRYPAPKGTLASARWVGAGFPDYPWLFATDGEYTAFASVALGQFEPIEDHLLSIMRVSRILNGDSGKVVHEVVSDGSVYFGSLQDDGNTDETAKFPSAVALVWRWSASSTFLNSTYSFARANMHYVVDQLDADRDGWPEGLGNVERNGMGEEKLDNTVYTIRGLTDLADMATAKGDKATAKWATKHARDLRKRFERAWYMANVPGYADSLDDPGDKQLYQRHWIGVTPAEVELSDGGLPAPGLAQRDHAIAMLGVHERRCYGDASGLFHTGEQGCDGAPPSPSEKHAFTLNTAIIAVGEGNYGRLGPTQQQRWTTANAAQQIPGVEQPGAMPEIASPSAIPEELGLVINRPFNERPSVLQAWGVYGTAWPVVHQQLGVQPDLGRGRLWVVPQPPSTTPIQGSQIRLGDDGTLKVSASRAGKTWTTVVDARSPVTLRAGATLPAGSKVADARLDGRRVRSTQRTTNRGVEVTIAVPAGSQHVVTITAR